MEASYKELYDRYQSLTTEELLEIKFTSDLTDMAMMFLEGLAFIKMNDWQLI